MIPLLDISSLYLQNKDKKLKWFYECYVSDTELDAFCVFVYLIFNKTLKGCW